MRLVFLFYLDASHWAAWRVTLWAELHELFRRIHATHGGELFAADDVGPVSDETLRAVLATLGHVDVSDPGQLGASYELLMAAEGRRGSGSHYTPSAMAADVVRRTVAPQVQEIGPFIHVCDPAVGGGVFLVEALRYLAPLVDLPLPEARLFVATHFLYGVDTNPMAVTLAKMALWLEVGAAERPFTIFDHCIKRGDALVGMSLEQIRGFHWKPKGPPVFCGYLTTEQERIVGDLIVGAFFAHKKPKDREKELQTRRALVQSWLASGGGELPKELHRMRDTMTVCPFHWQVEFDQQSAVIQARAA